MPIALSPALTPPVPTRVGIFEWPTWDEDSSIARIPLQLRSAAGTNVIVSRVLVEVRNGQSDAAVRAVPAAGENAADVMKVNRASISTPTGFDTTYAAFRGGATPAARRTAVETALQTLGVISASLVG